MTRHLLFFLSLLQLLFSQESEVIFTHLSTDDGLSQSTVSSILQDKNGFMWFGTRNGLNRYDGYNFKVFKHLPNQEKSISDNWITALLEDRKGRIWIASLDRGVSCFNPNSNEYLHFFRNDASESGLRSNSIQALAEGKKGVIWVGAREGLYKIENDKPVHYEFQTILKKKPIECLLFDDNLSLLIGTAEGLYILDEKNKKLQRFSKNNSSISDERITTLYRDAKKRIWIGTKNGLNELTHSKSIQISERFKKQFSKERIFAVHEDYLAQLWVGTYTGLYQISTDETTIKVFRKRAHDKTSLSNNEIRSIFQDKSLNLWIGTYGGGGINKLDLKEKIFDQFFSIKNNKKTISSNIVRSFLRDRKNRLWIGTRNGLNRFNEQTKEFDYFQASQKSGSISNNEIRSIYEDKKGHIWIGTEKGLNLFKEGSDTFVSFKHDPNDEASISHNEVFAICEDSKNRLWIGTNGGGLNLFDRDSKSFTHIATATNARENLRSDFISFIKEDHQSRLWIGSFGGGLHQLKETSSSFSFELYQHDPSNKKSISSNVIYSFYQDEKDRIWIGTKAGLNRFEAETSEFSLISVEQGLSDNYIYGIQGDNKLGLWISTVKGLNHYNTESQSIQNFDSESGLLNVEYKFSSSFKDKDYIYFGGVKGFTRIHLSEKREIKKLDTQIQITAINSFERQNNPNATFIPKSITEHLNIPEKISIAHSKNEFSISFASLDYSNSQSNIYAYKLEGLSSEWYEIGRQNTISFSKLKAGDYSLYLKTANFNKNWSEGKKLLELSVQSPFWLQTWFQFFVVTLVLALGFFVYQVRIQQIIQSKTLLEEMVDERTKDLEEAQSQLIQVEKLSSLGQMVAGITHEVNTPLAYISSNVGVLEELYQDREKELKAALDEKTYAVVKQIIESTLNGVDRLASLIRELKDFSRIDSPNFSPVKLSKIITSALRIAKHRTKSIEIVTNFDESVEVEGLPNQLNQVFINLINNSCDAMIAYRERSDDGKKSRLEIKLSPEKDTAFLSFSDNGGGIEKEIIHKIFDPFFTSKPIGKGVGLGLSISYNIITSHGGTIDVSSNKDGGTTFFIRLPYKQEDKKEINPYVS